MGVRVTSGEGRLIASGTITTFFGAPLELDLVDWGYSVVWRFQEDDGDVRLWDVDAFVEYARRDEAWVGAVVESFEQFFALFGVGLVGECRQ